MSENLLPCPHCGGNAGLQCLDEELKGSARTLPWWIVECNDCWAMTSKFTEQQDAVKAWNRRASDATPAPVPGSDLVAQLRAWADPIESGYEVPAAGRCIREAADRIEALEKERDEWIAHTKRAVWADSEECKVLEECIEKLEAELEELDFLRHEGGKDSVAALEARCKALEQALREIERKTCPPDQGEDKHAPSILNLNAIARAALGENNE